MNRRKMTTAAAGMLAAVLTITAAAGLPVRAADGGPSGGGWEETKEQILEALDELRDLGFSPMEIVDSALGGGNQTDPDKEEAHSAGGTGEAVLEMGSSLQEKAQEAGDMLAQKAAEAGEEVIGQTEEAARDTAKSWLDRLLEDVKLRLDDWLDSIFEK